MANVANDLISVIKAKQGEIAKLQAELDEAKALLLGRPEPTRPAQVARPAAKTLHRPKGGRRSRKTASGATEALVPDSTAYFAAEAIRAAGRPLHANDIVRAVEQAGQKIKLATLVGSLSRWVSRRSVFYRAGKNVFGLIEMRKG